MKYKLISYNEGGHLPVLVVEVTSGLFRKKTEHKTYIRLVGFYDAVTYERVPVSLECKFYDLIAEFELNNNLGKYEIFNKVLGDNPERDCYLEGIR